MTAPVPGSARRRAVAVLPRWRRTGRGRTCRPAPSPGARSGMTLVELMIALTIFGVVISISLAFIAVQNTAFQGSVQRLVALRNLRYAFTVLSQDLKTLGTNVPEQQPSLVYAGDDVVAFSADYATNVADDPFAVFYDPDAPDGQVSVPATAVSIPNSSASFPDTLYEVSAGALSPAEVLVFYLVEDSLTERTDDHVLYRQVNGGEPEQVARNLLRSGATPFFSYLRLTSDTTGATLLEAVDPGQLPLEHGAKIHLSAADTGQHAIIDSVRAVQVTFISTNGLTGEHEDQVELGRLIPFPNAGTSTLSTCGSDPILGGALGAAVTVLTTGEPAVLLTWSPAVDEDQGEEDVVRYVLWRRLQGAGSWGDPYLAIPAGKPTYNYTDASVQIGASYEYALAAQDCTPSLSDLTSAGPVTIP